MAKDVQENVCRPTDSGQKSSHTEAMHNDVCSTNQSDFLKKMNDTVSQCSKSMEKTGELPQCRVNDNGDKARNRINGTEGSTPENLEEGKARKSADSLDGPETRKEGRHGRNNADDRGQGEELAKRPEGSVTARETQKDGSYVETASKDGHKTNVRVGDQTGKWNETQLDQNEKRVGSTVHVPGQEGSFTERSFGENGELRASREFQKTAEGCKNSVSDEQGTRTDTFDKRGEQTSHRDKKKNGIENGWQDNADGSRVHFQHDGANNQIETATKKNESLPEETQKNREQKAPEYGDNIRAAANAELTPEKRVDAARRLADLEGLQKGQSTEFVSGADTSSRFKIDKGEGDKITLSKQETDPSGEKKWTEVGRGGTDTARKDASEQLPTAKNQTDPAQDMAAIGNDQIPAADRLKAAQRIAEQQNLKPGQDYRPPSGDDTSKPQYQIAMDKDGHVALNSLQTETADGRQVGATKTSITEKGTLTEKFDEKNEQKSAMWQSLDGRSERGYIRNDEDRSITHINQPDPNHRTETRWSPQSHTLLNEKQTDIAADGGRTESEYSPQAGYRDTTKKDAEGHLTGQTRQFKDKASGWQARPDGLYSFFHEKEGEGRIDGVVDKQRNLISQTRVNTDGSMTGEINGRDGTAHRFSMNAQGGAELSTERPNEPVKTETLGADRKATEAALANKTDANPDQQAVINAAREFLKQQNQGSTDQPAKSFNDILAKEAIQARGADRSAELVAPETDKSIAAKPEKLEAPIREAAKEQGTDKSLEQCANDPNKTTGQFADKIRERYAAGDRTVTINGEQYRAEVEGIGKGNDSYVHLFKQQADGKEQIAFRAIHRAGEGGTEQTQSATGGHYEQQQGKNGPVDFVGTNFGRENSDNALTRFSVADRQPGAEERLSANQPARASSEWREFKPNKAIEEGLPPEQKWDSSKQPVPPLAHVLAQKMELDQPSTDPRMQEWKQNTSAALKAAMAKGQGDSATGINEELVAHGATPESAGAITGLGRREQERMSHDCLREQLSTFANNPESVRDGAPPQAGQFDTLRNSNPQGAALAGAVDRYAQDLASTGPVNDKMLKDLKQSFDGNRSKFDAANPEKAGGDPEVHSQNNRAALAAIMGISAEEIQANREPQAKPERQQSSRLLEKPEVTDSPPVAPNGKAPPEFGKLIAQMAQHEAATNPNLKGKTGFGECSKVPRLVLDSLGVRMEDGSHIPGMSGSSQGRMLENLKSADGRALFERVPEGERPQAGDYAYRDWTNPKRGRMLGDSLIVTRVDDAGRVYGANGATRNEFQVTTKNGYYQPETYLRPTAAMHEQYKQFAGLADAPTRDAKSEPRLRASSVPDETRKPAAYTAPPERTNESATKAVFDASPDSSGERAVAAVYYPDQDRKIERDAAPEMVQATKAIFRPQEDFSPDAARVEQVKMSRPEALESGIRTGAHAGDMYRDPKDWGNIRRSQAGFKNGCAPIAMSIAEADFSTGKVADDSRASQWYKLAGTNSSAGYRRGLDGIAHDLERGTNGQIKAEVHNGNGPRAVADLRETLARGEGAVVSINNPRTGNGHYIYAMGISKKDGSILVADPGYVGNRSLSSSELSHQMRFGFVAVKNDGQTAATQTPGTAAFNLAEARKEGRAPAEPAPLAPRERADETGTPARRAEAERPPQPSIERPRQTPVEPAPHKVPNAQRDNTQSVWKNATAADMLQHLYAPQDRSAKPNQTELRADQTVREKSAIGDRISNAPADSLTPPTVQDYQGVQPSAYTAGKGGSINGGKYDMHERLVRSTSDFFNSKNPSSYVSVAVDMNAHVKDGQLFYSPQLDKMYAKQLDAKYGNLPPEDRHMWLRATDTGGAFRGTWSGQNSNSPTRLDLAVGSEREASVVSGDGPRKKNPEDQISLRMMPESDRDRVAALSATPTRPGKEKVSGLDFGYRDEYREKHKAGEMPVRLIDKDGQPQEQPVNSPPKFKPAAGLDNTHDFTPPKEIMTAKEIARPQDRLSAVVQNPSSGARVEKLTGMGSDQFANAYALYGMENRSDKHLDGNGKPSPDAIVHVNKNFDSSKPANVVFYNHGWFTSAKDSYDNKGKFVKNFNLGKQLESADPQTVVVVPAWQPVEGSRDSNDGKLGAAGSYSRMLNEVMSKTPGLSHDVNGVSKPLTVDDVQSVGIITHSAGYWPTVNQLNDPKLADKVKFVGVLDSLYGGARTGHQVGWTDANNGLHHRDFRAGINAWIKNHESSFKNQTAGYLNVYGDNDPRIADSSRAQISDLWSKSSQPSYAQVLDGNASPQSQIGVRPITIIHSGLTHSDIPRTYFKDAIRGFEQLRK